MNNKEKEANSSTRIKQEIMSARMSEICDRDIKGGADFEFTLKLLKGYRRLKYFEIGSRTREFLHEMILKHCENLSEIDGNMQLKIYDKEKDLCSEADVYMALEISDQMFYTRNIITEWMENARMPHQLAVIARIDASVELLKRAGFVKEAALLHARYMTGIKQKSVAVTMEDLGYKNINAYYKAHERAVSLLSRYMHDLDASDPFYDDPAIKKMIWHLMKAGEYAALSNVRITQ